MHPIPIPPKVEYDKITTKFSAHYTLSITINTQCRSLPSINSPMIKHAFTSFNLSQFRTYPNILFLALRPDIAENFIKGENDLNILEGLRASSEIAPFLTTQWE